MGPVPGTHEHLVDGSRLQISAERKWDNLSCVLRKSVLEAHFPASKDALSMGKSQNFLAKRELSET